jgi:hypothetical protein
MSWKLFTDATNSVREPSTSPLDGAVVAVGVGVGVGVVGARVAVGAGVEVAAGVLVPGVVVS